MSDYFDSTQNRISDGNRAKGADVNNLRDETGVAFDKLPTPDDIKQGKTTYGVDTGAADAYVVALTNAQLAYVTGMEVAFIPLNTSVGASTINVDGLGAKNIKQPDDTEISAGVIAAGSVVTLRYNGTYFTVTGGGVLDSTAAAAASAAAAAVSAAAALVSENAAAASETAAGNSETAAGTSETNAGTSETNAAASAAAAAASASVTGALETDLASNANAEGASKIGVEDPAGKITATTVEGALAEIAADDWVTSARLANGLLINANAVQFNLAAGVSVAEGQLAWNPVSKTVDLGMPGGVVQQIGQEMPLYVKNTSGVTVNDGDAVYVSGSTGVNLIIGLADASDFTKCNQVGVVTTAAGIVHNGFGIVARFGAVRDIDTSGTPVGEVWADNDLLYISATTPGALTKTPPGTPHFTVAIGVVINAHAVQGVLGVDPKQAISANAVLGTSNLYAPTVGAAKSYVDGVKPMLDSDTANSAVAAGGGGYETLMSFTIPAGTFGANDGFVVKLKGTFAGTAGNKRLTIDVTDESAHTINGTVITSTTSAGAISGELEVLERTDSAAVKYSYLGVLALGIVDHSVGAGSSLVISEELTVVVKGSKSDAGDAVTVHSTVIEQLLRAT